MTEPVPLSPELERGPEVVSVPPGTVGRRMMSGISHLMLANGIVKLVAILTLPILTRLLDPEAYGVATLLATTGSLASVIALGGVDISYTRAYYSTVGPNGNIVENFTWQFALFSSALLAFVTALVWQHFATGPTLMSAWLALILFLAIVLLDVNSMSLARARLHGRYRAMALSIVATGLVSAIGGVVIALFWRRDAIALLIPTLLTYGLPVLLLGTPGWNALSTRSPLTRDQQRAVLRIGLPAVVTAPMYWLLSSSDRWFLQYFKGSAVVGIYSIGYSVAVVGTMVNNAVMTVWLAEAAREFEFDPGTARASLGRLMSRLIAAMAIVWLIADAAGGDIVRLVADPRFRQAAEWVPLIAGGVFFYGVAQLSAYGLVLVKKLTWAAIWWFVGGVLCVGLNLLLVPRYGAIGAALTQAISFGAIAICILVTSQLNYRMQLAWQSLAITGLVTLISGMALATAWHSNPLVSLVLKLPAGVIVSVVIGWFAARDWTEEMFNQVRTQWRRLAALARSA